MKKVLLLSMLALTLTACDSGSKGGGGGGAAPVPLVYGCMDENATNYDPLATGPGNNCVCPSGYNTIAFGNACQLIGGGGGPTEPAPTLVYTPSTRTLVVNVSATPISPTVTNCSSANNCSFSMAGGTVLPSGLSLNPVSGVITGLPTATMTRNVSIRVQTDNGAVTASLSLTITPPPPAGLQINNLAASKFYERGLTISPITFSYSSGDGSITNMSVSPTLPSGLSLNKISPEINQWRIVGSPTVTTSLQTYTVTATGPNGSPISLNFQLGTALKPSNFSYNISGHSSLCVMDGSIPLCSFSLGQTSSAIPAVVTGDFLEFDIISGGESPIPSDELPSGIILSGYQVPGGNGGIYSVGTNETTSGCSLGGNKTCLYTIRAYNVLGHTDTQIKIKITNSSGATSFNYASSPYLFRRKTAIGSSLTPSWQNNILPSCQGGGSCYSISPTLPAGLSFSSLSGAISGAPDNISSPTVYTVSANDENGIITTTLSIEVKERIPIFNYTQNGVYILQKNRDADIGAGAPAIIQLSGGTPEEGGGPSVPEGPLCGPNAIPVTSFSISPSLPPGLSLNTGSYSCGAIPSLTGGAISGVPTEINGTKTYTISGCNSGGCGTATISLEVAPLFIKMVTGDRHSCALVKEDNQVNSPTKVMCWGANDLGQLGYASNQTCSHSTLGSINCQKYGRFVKLSGLDLTGAEKIVAGKNHTCIQQTQAGNIKRVLCWGDNSLGQLGNGNLSYSLNPVVMIRNPDDHVFTKVSQIAAGGDQTCIAAEESNSAYEGNEIVDQVFCSDSSSKKMIKKSDPSDTIDQLLLVGGLSVGENHACSVFAEFSRSIVAGKYEISYDRIGGIKCWGQNNLGQLGDNSTNSSVNPVLVTGTNTLFPANSGGGSEDPNNLELISGGNHNCYKMPSNAVSCWGSNEFGQLARGTAGPGNYLATPGLVPMGAVNTIDLHSVSSLGATKQASFFYQYAPISSGGDVYSFLYTSGRFHVAGSPYSGTQSVTPTILRQSSGNFFSTSLPFSSGASTLDFSCLGGPLGGAYCYGNNEVGQLGTDTISSSVTPVKINFSND